MIKHPEEHPWDIIERLNLLQSNDDDETTRIAKEVLDKYPDKVEEYRNGKKGVLSLFMGDVMKAGKGKINPKTASEIVKNLLEEKREV
jgi:aspartyl-tRNA(Asn)/glutamyl-tRNA(Gln) amidotransferase subunit B